MTKATISIDGSLELLPPRGSHIMGLDGLRGIAILMVMGTHILLPNAAVPGRIHLWMRAAADSLWMGVDLFFVLSGFLITGILLDSLASQHYFRNFYMRRVLRIFPLYYAVLVVFIVCAPMLHIAWGGQLMTLLTYTNRIFINPRSPGFHFYFGGENNLVNFWSLAVEEQFYFVWPLLVFLSKRARNVMMFATILIVAVLATRFFLVGRHTAADVVYVSLACRGDSLLIGALLAAAMRHGYREKLLRLARPVAFLGTAVLAALFLVQHGLKRDSVGMMEFGFTALAIYFASLVTLTLQPSGWVAAKCSSAFLRFFGRYSYGLYILHSILPAFYGNWLLPWISSRIHNQTMANAVIAATKFSIAVAAALLSYHLLEQPFLRLKRYFPSFQKRVHPAS